MSCFSGIINKLILFILVAFSISFSQVRNFSGDKNEKRLNRYSTVLPSVQYRLPVSFYKFGLTNLDERAIKTNINNLSYPYNFNQMKQNIRMGFNLIQKANERKSLGMFGKILGYTNFAATIGLAAYHIYKYGWNGNKQKRKK